MWQVLKKWFDKKRSTPTVTKAAQTVLPNIIAEQVHLHWHISDLAQVPGRFTWNARFDSLNTPVLQQAVPKATESLAYDEQLPERAKTQWQFGDWESLAALSREEIEGHSERAKLALLIATGYLQLGKNDKAKDFVILARDWGCDKRLISRFLIAGVYDSLGRAAASKNDLERSAKHFKNVFKTVIGQTDQVEQLSQIRIEQTRVIQAASENTKSVPYSFSNCLQADHFTQNHTFRLSEQTNLTLTASPVWQTVTVQAGFSYYIEGQVVSDCKGDKHALALFDFLTCDEQPIIDKPVGLSRSEVGFYAYLKINQIGSSRFFLTFTVPENCFKIRIGFRTWGNPQETIQLNSVLELIINTNHWEVAYDSEAYRQAVASYRQGYEAIDQKRYLDAVKEFKQAEELAPQFVFPYWLMRQENVYDSANLSCLDEKQRYTNSWAITEALFVQILSLLPAGSTILELGSGTGTRELCRYYEVVSVEHDTRWLHQAPARYIHAPLDNDYWYNFRIIAEAINELSYDLLLVDGPPQHRRMGFIDHLDLFRKDIPIILDDIVRTEETYLLHRLEQYLGKTAKKYINHNKGFAIFN